MVQTAYPNHSNNAIAKFVSKIGTRSSKKLGKERGHKYLRKGGKRYEEMGWVGGQKIRSENALTPQKRRQIQFLVLTHLNGKMGGISAGSEKKKSKKNHI